MNKEWEIRAFPISLGLGMLMANGKWRWRWRYTTDGAGSRELGLVSTTCRIGFDAFVGSVRTHLCYSSIPITRLNEIEKFTWNIWADSIGLLSRAGQGRAISFSTISGQVSFYFYT
jgi:hypothetical protein